MSQMIKTFISACALVMVAACGGGGGSGSTGNGGTAGSGSVNGISMPSTVSAVTAN